MSGPPAARARCRRAAAALVLAAAWSAGAVLPALAAALDDAALADCRVPGVAHAVRCGVLIRPLDPSQPDGVRFELHYVVVPALARHKRDDPVFVLAGGPGQSAIGLAGHMTALLERLGNRRDIVLVDQRGTGRSAPLDCDEPRHAPLAEWASSEIALRRMRQCQRALQSLPHVGGAEGLRHYATTLAMQDLDAVRTRLGAPRINLVGASYGTRAALEYLRQYPQHVRRGVLDGVVPPDMRLPSSMGIDAQAAFESLLAACEADADCARRHPTLRADWAFLLAGLPRPVTLAHPYTGRTERFELRRELVYGVVRSALYTPALAAGLPGAVTEAAQGRPVALIGLAAQMNTRSAARLWTGMHYAVLCSEDLPPASGGDGRDAAESADADFGGPALRLIERICAGWPRGMPPPEFFRVPASASPMLLLSGGLDPATPPRHGARVAQSLGPLARHVVVPQVGHGVMALPCMRELVFRFIDADDDGDALALDTGCARTLPRPPAFAPVDPFGAAR